MSPLPLLLGMIFLLGLVKYGRSVICYICDVLEDEVKDKCTDTTDCSILSPGCIKMFVKDWGRNETKIVKDCSLVTKCTGVKYPLSANVSKPSVTVTCIFCPEDKCNSETSWTGHGFAILAYTLLQSQII